MAGDAPPGSGFRPSARATNHSKSCSANQAKSCAADYTQSRAADYTQSRAADYSKPSAADRVTHAYSQHYTAAVLTA